NGDIVAVDALLTYIKDVEQQENKSKPARRSFQKKNEGKTNLNDLFDANKIKSTDEIIDILISKNIINKQC
ncbi:hypothetical protein U2060_14880, partial [Listeria monocytogenes]|uniref:hypothetical protein n=1 Tax=Listeria monocytogenes TaxID=1639 RepID=UPI002FDC5BC8